MTWLRTALAHVIMWALPALAWQLGRQHRKLRELQAQVESLQAYQLGQAEYVAAIARALHRMNDRQDLMATQPTDRQLHARVAKIEMLLLAPDDDSVGERMLEEALVRAMCSDGEGVKS